MLELYVHQEEPPVGWGWRLQQQPQQQQPLQQQPLQQKRMHIQLIRNSWESLGVLFKEIPKNNRYILHAGEALSLPYLYRCCTCSCSCLLSGPSVGLRCHRIKKGRKEIEEWRPLCSCRSMGCVLKRQHGQHRQRKAATA